MSILKIKNANGEWQGVTAVKGDKGEDGISPQIVVTTNNSNTYKLRVTTKDKEFITPNLKGDGGSGSGNVNAELGTIDNYCDFDGENIPPYMMDMPPLPIFKGGARYAFERPVVMRVYNGDKDSNGNYDIDKYLTFEATLNTDTGLYECVVLAEENGFLTDYVIYNPIPKKEWDTWENPNIVKVLPVTSSKIHREYKTNTFAMLPNLRIKNTNGTAIYESGEAYIDYTRYVNALGKPYTKAGDYAMAVYRREDFPFILDEPVKYWDYDEKNKKYSENPVEIPYYDNEGNCPSAAWQDKVNGVTAFKVGCDHTIDGMNLGCCDPESDFWGNAVLMSHAENIKDNNLLETREYDWVIAKPQDVNNHLGDYGAKPLAPAMYIGLEPNHNYTIETTAGNCAIVTPTNNTNKFITKEVQVQYPSTIRTEVVTKNSANDFANTDIGSSSGGALGAGSVTGGSKLENGTVQYFNVVDTSGDPMCKMEVPVGLSCPNKYLNRGESYTFYVDDDAEMYGIWVLCENEDDYKGIKVVEGVESYSLLMAERMASGATKFNLKVYTEKWDRDDIKGEYNIKLCDNTTENSYCRFLDNNTIKHYDLDVFTMVGHTHPVEELTNFEEYMNTVRAQIPVMRLSTAPLVAGEDALPENTFHFVYEE